MGQVCSSSLSSTEAVADGSKRNNNKDDGVGYSGSNRLDKRRLLEGRQEAASVAEQRDAVALKFLSSMQTRLVVAGSWSSVTTTPHPLPPPSPPDDSEIQELCRTLQDIFRNLLTDKTESRSELYDTALECCRLLASDPEHYGRWLRGDGCSTSSGDCTTTSSSSSSNIIKSESLLTCLEQTAQQASLMVKYQGTHGLADQDLQLCEKIIEVKDLVADAAMESSRSVPLNKEAKSFDNSTVITASCSASTDSDSSSVTTASAGSHCNMSSTITTSSSSPLANNSTTDPSHQYRTLLGPHRFDLVEEQLKTYAYRSTEAVARPITLDTTRRLFKELAAYQTALPVELGSSIFVRAVEGRLNQLRVLITGPEETPYAHGCFFFDVFLPATYPAEPPLVQFLTTGGGTIRFNPNLYKCGKVCLSLLGTWVFGPGWVPGESTLLQVLVSIQSLVLVSGPYFNEPAFQRRRGTTRGQSQSVAYNRNISQYTLQHALLHYLEQLVVPVAELSPSPSLMSSSQQPTAAAAASYNAYTVTGYSCDCDYPEFADIMRLHFWMKKKSIMKVAQAWIPTLNSISVQQKQDLLHRFVHSLSLLPTPTTTIT